MTTVHLHIGNPKTGSSYMQSLLRKNAAMLARHGISYPVDRGVNLSDASITSGNGSFLIADAARRNQFFSTQNPDTDLLISSELLAAEIAESGQFDAFIADFKRLGFDRLNVLLLIRDPIEYAASAYQQNIKRSGMTHDVDAHFEGFKPRIDRILKLLNELLAYQDVELRVLNYANWRSKLPQLLQEWLQVPTEFEVPLARIINRSLTRSEFNLQKMLNAQLGVSGQILADKFCELLPDVVAETEYPSLDVQQRFCDRIGPVVDKINALVPPGERLGMTFIDPTPVPEGNYFSDAQLEVIAEAIAKRELLLRERVPQIAHHDSWPKVLERKIRLALRRVRASLFAR